MVHINGTAGKHYWISSLKDLVPAVSGKQVENTIAPHNVLLPKHPGRGTFYRGKTSIGCKRKTALC